MLLAAERGRAMLANGMSKCQRPRLRLAELSASGAGDLVGSVEATRAVWRDSSGNGERAHRCDWGSHSPPDPQARRSR
jgi:hypothetical protein